MLSEGAYYEIIRKCTDFPSMHEMENLSSRYLANFNADKFWEEKVKQLLHKKFPHSDTAKLWAKTEIMRKLFPIRQVYYLLFTYEFWTQSEDGESAGEELKFLEAVLEDVESKELVLYALATRLTITSFDEIKDLDYDGGSDLISEIIHMLMSENKVEYYRYILNNVDKIIQFPMNDNIFITKAQFINHLVNQLLIFIDNTFYESMEDKGYLLDEKDVARIMDILFLLREFVQDKISQKQINLLLNTFPKKYQIKLLKIFPNVKRDRKFYKQRTRTSTPQYYDSDDDDDITAAPFRNL